MPRLHTWLLGSCTVQAKGTPLESYCICCAANIGDTDWLHQIDQFVNITERSTSLAAKIGIGKSNLLTEAGLAAKQPSSQPATLCAIECSAAMVVKVTIISRPQLVGEK